MKHLFLLLMRIAEWLTSLAWRCRMLLGTNSTVLSAFPAPVWSNDSLNTASLKTESLQFFMGLPFFIPFCEKQGVCMKPFLCVFGSFHAFLWFTLFSKMWKTSTFHKYCVACINFISMREMKRTRWSAPSYQCEMWLTTKCNSIINVSPSI